MQYIVVKNWERFQHYKDRNPLWIKLYIDLLQDYSFSQLSDAAKLQLMLLWLIAAKHNNRVPFDKKWLKTKMEIKGELRLEELLQFGFIDLTTRVASSEESTMAQDASNLLAQPEESCSNLLALARSRETETETETEKRREETDKNGVPFFAPSRNGGVEAGAESDPVVLIFPVTGGDASWDLTQSRLDQYRELFPEQNILSHCKHARQWLIDNPVRRKTSRGMPKFLTGWLERNINRGWGKGMEPDEEPPTPEELAQIEKAKRIREQKLGEHSHENTAES